MRDENGYGHHDENWGQRGQVFPLLLLIVLATLGIGLALFQVGRASALRSDAQSGADAAALAAVRNLREQLDRMIAQGRVPDPAAIDPGELRAAAADYAGRNKAEVLSVEQLGVDVRVGVRTGETLGDTARPIDSEDERGSARARASMSLQPTVLATGPGEGADPGAISGDTSFKDKDWDALEDKLGEPPFSVEDVVTLGRFLQEHGLRVSEHPAFGGVTAVHKHYPPNDHYSGGAIDINSPISDAAEAPVFDAITPRLKAMGWNVLWRVPGHAPGDNSHMHLDKSPASGSSTPGQAGALPVLGPGGSGDVSTEIRLVSWEGDATSLGLASPSTGNPFGAPDIEVACEIYRVGKSMRVSDRIMLAAFETAIVESGVHNLNYGDRDSHGVFQQQWSQGWGTLQQTMNVPYASRRFFASALEKDRGQPVGNLAQDVQISAFPDRYAERESQARALIDRVKDGCGTKS